MEANVSVSRKRKGLTQLGVLVTGIAVLSALLVAGSASIAPGPSDKLAGPMRFTSVASSPGEPLAWEDITVTARLEGPVFPQAVNLQYAAYFATTETGGVQMTSRGGRVYEAKLPGFPDGTEVWIVVAANSASGDPVISQSHTIQVGAVQRGGASGLRITEVSHSPAEPLAFDRITVEAWVSSYQPVTEVDVAYMAFCPSRPPGGIDPPMTVVAPNRYTIDLEPDPQCGFMPGTLIVYRVLAEDASGNTAVSEDGSIQIAQVQFFR